MRGRVVALDLGSRRIGVAVSDPSGTLASPHVVLERAGGRRADHRAVAEVVAGIGAERVVVGLPLSLDGSAGPAAQLVLAEVEQLRPRLEVPVECHDERFSTVSADRTLVAAGIRAPARRRLVDKVAATVVLQSWLDCQSAREEPG